MPADLSPLTADVVRVTQELSRGQVEIEVIGHFEYPQDRLTVIEPQERGDVADAVHGRQEWHRRVARRSPSCSALRLTLDHHE